MKKAARLLALVLTLCMLLSITAMADPFETTVNVDGTDLVVTGDVDSNGNITLKTINDMDATQFPEDDLTQSIKDAVKAEVYDVDAARAATFMNSSASGEASGSSGEAVVVYEPGKVIENADGSVTVTGGVVETVKADVLILEDVGPVKDKLLTLVADSVEIPIEDGTYKNAAIVVTDYIHPDDGLYSGSMTTSAGTAYRSAITFDGGVFDAATSATPAVQSGDVGHESATNVVIDSDAPYFNGFILNDTDYTIDGMFMTANGSGGSDFKGWGAGVANTGTTNSVINGLVFLGQGAVRHGVYAGGEFAEDGLNVTVNDSYIRADGSKYDNTSTGAMSSCPWMLGISPSGHARTTMADGYTTIGYNGSILLSDGWGILSTDDVSKPVEWGAYSLNMTVTDTIVDVTCDGSDDPSAYGTYAIGACRNLFYGSHIGNAMGSDLYKENVAKLADYGVDYSYDTVEYGLTYAAVVANEYASVGYYDDSIVNTKYGVMFHKTNNVRFADGKGNVEEAGLTEVKDSTFKTYGAAFLVKACTPVINVENSLFVPEKGVIVQLMTCDDPGMGAANFSETLFTDADAFAATVEADPAYDPYDYNLITRNVFSTPVEDYINDVQVSFADCTGDTALNGDFFNSITVSTTGEGMTWWGQNLILSFDNCEINGAISSSSALHVEYGYYTDDAGNVIEADTTEAAIAAGATRGVIDSASATLLGNLDNTPTQTVNNGVWVTLTGGSVWTPDETCYISRLYVDGTSAVNGTVTVDGKAVTVEAGKTYTGAIVVTPAGGAASGESSANAAPAAAEGAYPHFAEYQDEVAAYALADDFMASQAGIPGDIYAADTPYAQVFQDIVPVIGAMDYASWMAANHAGESFPAA